MGLGIVSQRVSLKLLASSALVTLALCASVSVQAADLSALIELGGTVDIDGADTFNVDALLDGDPAVSIVFTDDATAGTDSLTVSSNGNDPNDTGQIGSLSVLDNNGTNSLIINDATNGDDFTFQINGNISGDVATDANDLSIVVNSTLTDTGTIFLELGGHLDLGSGSVTLTGDANDTSQISFINTAGDQTITGSIVSTTDDVGSVVLIRNGTRTATFNDAIGAQGASGIANLLIGDTSNTGQAVFTSTVDAGTLVIDGDQGDSSADFDDDVTGSIVRLESGAAGTTIARFSGDVNVTEIQLDEETATPTVFFDGGSAQSVTGAINGAMAGEGDVRFGTNSIVTFHSEIGATAIDSFAATGATLTLRNNLTTQDDLPTNVGLFLDSATTFTLDSSLNTIAVSENTGDIDIDGTTYVTGSNDVSLSAASDLFLDGSLTTELSGASTRLTLSGTNSLLIGTGTDTTITAGNQIVTGSDLTLGTGGRSSVVFIRKTDDFDPSLTPVIDATDDIITLGGTLTVGIDSASQSFSVGDRITVIESNQNATTSYAALIASDSILFEGTALLELRDDGSDTQDLKVIIAVTEDIDGVDGDEEEALDESITATGDGDDDEAQDAILGLMPDETQAAAQQLIADNSGGAATTLATASNMSTGFDVVGARLSDLRRDKSGLRTGLSGGDAYSSSHAWFRGIGYTADQEDRNGVLGYIVDTVGVLAGMDGLLDNNTRFGINAGYSETHVDGGGSGDHETDIGLYRLGIYGGRDFQRYYIEGQASASYHDIQTSRRITFGGLNRTAIGDTNGYGYGMRIGAGMPLVFKPNQYITPYTDFQFIHVSVDDYAETGADSLNIHVDNEDINIAELIFGTKYSADLTYNRSVFSPEIRAAIAYDFIGDTPVSHQTFTGGGSAFQVRGISPVQLSANYGAGISWRHADHRWEFSLNYDGKVKSDYLSHGARFEAKVRF